MQEIKQTILEFQSPLSPGGFWGTIGPVKNVEEAKKLVQESVLGDYNYRVVTIEGEFSVGGGVASKTE